MGQGTRAHAMALFVILSSPMTMLPDSPSDYYREQECTDFLANIPVEWDETRLLEGKIGRYTILGRRAGDQWFVGAITDWGARKFTLNTDFLNTGKYQVDIISDGINADTRAERLFLESEESSVIIIHCHLSFLKTIVFRPGSRLYGWQRVFADYCFYLF